MNWLKTLFGWNEKRAITYATGSQSGLLSAPTRSGIHVTEETALGVSAVWCAVRVISESVGSLPLVTYRKGPNGERERAEDEPLYPILHTEPNPEMTRNVFFEVLMSHALLHGTAYAEIERNNAGDPIALWPISPQYVQVLRDTESGELVYRVVLPPGVLHNPHDQTAQIIRQADMIAIPGLSPDGSAGYHLLSIARDNIGFSIACDRFGSAFFGNGARLGGLLKSPNRLSDEARENLKKSWSQQYSGVDNSGKTGLLEEGLTYDPISYKDDGALYTTTRQFQITEIARLFNISPVKLHELGRATWGNLATLNTDFYITTLRPWLEKIESELERKLFGAGSEYYCEFLADSILRGDTTTRYAAYNVAITAGFLTVDEVRGFENLPPLTDEQKAELKPAPSPVIVQAPDNLADDSTDTQTQVTDAKGE